MPKVSAANKITMRTFDVGSITPIQNMTPRKIRALRRREAGSVEVLATLLNVTSTLVEKWERGEAKPHGASLKLLSIVEVKGMEIIV